MIDRWSARPHDRRASIKIHSIRRLPFRHMSCILNKNRVELSPAREKLKKSIGFKRSDVFSGLIFPSDIWKAEHIINYIKYNYKYVHTSPRRVGARVGPRGSATWPCVPRRTHVGPARKLTPFLLFVQLF